VNVKAIKKWRYYCDYCKKSGGSKYHMENHEKICTMRPDRHCAMCQHIEDESPPNLKNMISIINEATLTLESEWGGEYTSFVEPETEKSVIEKLKKITSCPACILSALRQSGCNYMFTSFDYKKEKEKFWQPINAERHDEFLSMVGHVW
jgi:hypothetical protein